jgi:hypothetical protein
VIFSEPVSSVTLFVMASLTSIKETSNQPIMAVTHTSTVSAQQTPAVNLLPNLNNDLSLWNVIDPDIVHDNPVEDKHRRLVRSHRSSPYDRELKPNAKIRDELGVRKLCGALSEDLLALS